MDDIDKVLAERGERYGDFFSGASIAVALKNVMFTAMHQSQRPLEPDMLEAMEQIFSKVARIINGDAKHVDSWRDIGGYAKLIVNRLEAEQRINRAAEATRNTTTKGEAL
jgi:hypothetical protein